MIHVQTKSQQNNDANHAYLIKMEILFDSSHTKLGILYDNISLHFIM